ncbi:hypothetical protein CDAR_511511 [Caerostris darwini]|uniref:Uncharacterized protein n=1 Tax=Caerostris darwini TaxID=1538125 RepID=A0AAV4TQB3_9ARAC|nr:hypothetical protein CDAR_511511 [Caerostris darwini]
MGVKIFSTRCVPNREMFSQVQQTLRMRSFLMVPMEVIGRQRSIRRITLDEDILHIVEQTPSFGAVKCSSPKTILTNIFFYTKLDYTVTSSKSSLTAGVRTSAISIWDTYKYIRDKYIFTVDILCAPHGCDHLRSSFFIFLQELLLKLLAIKVLYSCIPTVGTFPSLSEERDVQPYCFKAVSFGHLIAEDSPVQCPSLPYPSSRSPNGR